MMRAKSLALAAIVVLACSGVSTPSSVGDDRQLALHALANVRAAVAEIVQIEDGYATGHQAYLRAAHRTLNAIVGRGDREYDKAAGDPGDGIGAVGYVDRLLDRRETSRWTTTIEGAKANLLAAAQNVHDALHEKEMENYQGDLTLALSNLSLAVGRPDREGVLGGIAGALGTTSLGVPAHVAQVSGCASAGRAPSYGVADGRLVYVALPLKAGATAVPDNLSVSRVVVDHGTIVLYTPVIAPARACAPVARTSLRQQTRAVVVAAASSANPPYTTAQARAGAKVYQASCVQCHGANLQGTAAPAVAGKAFVTAAKGNKWTLEDVRTLVVQNMPANNPGSLSPTQYAQVMAFLLAANCYPPGSKPFPQNDDPSFAKIPIQPLPGAHPTNSQLGTCTVK